MGFHKRQIGFLTLAAKFYDLRSRKLLTNPKIQLQYFPLSTFSNKKSYHVADRMYVDIGGQVNAKR